MIPIVEVIVLEPGTEHTELFDKCYSLPLRPSLSHPSLCQYIVAGTLFICN